MKQFSVAGVFLKRGMQEKMEKIICPLESYEIEAPAEMQIKRQDIIRDMHDGINPASGSNYKTHGEKSFE